VQTELQTSGQEQVGIACHEIKSIIGRIPNLVILVVKEGCPYCEEVLSRVTALHLRLETYIVNVSRCWNELQALAEVDSAPAALEFQAGREVRRVIGADEVLAFLAAPAN
jgi:hypothetical protein